jgi:hypothetical protein
MDHLEVVKLMEQSGGKVWEEGNVSAPSRAQQYRHTPAAAFYEQHHLGVYRLVARASFIARLQQ